MLATSDIPSAQTAPPSTSELRARKSPLRTGHRAVGEVLVTLPLHPLSAPIRQLAADLDLSAYAVNRAIDAIAGDGVGIVRTSDQVGVAPQSWQEAQQRGEAYWTHTYEFTPNV
jgi:hypothetical protein